MTDENRMTEPTCQTALLLPLQTVVCNAELAGSYTTPGVEMLLWHHLVHV